MTEFNLSAERMFRAMRVATDASRHYLQGILIEPILDGGAWLVATNGRSMLIQRDRTAVAPRRALLSVSAIDPRTVPDDDEREWNWKGAQIACPVTADDHTIAAPVYWWNSSRARTHVVVRFLSGVEDYPDWRQAIYFKKNAPEPGPALERYRAASLQAFSAAAHWSRVFAIHQKEPGSPLLISFPEDEDALGVVAAAASASRNITRDILIDIEKSAPTERKQK